jgi:hypothetical protein
MMTEDADCLLANVRIAGTRRSTTGRIRYICRSRYLEPLSRLQMHNVTAAARQVRGDIAEI